MEVKLDIGNDSEVRSAINKMIREEFNKVLEEKICRNVFDHLNGSYNNVIEQSIKKIIQNSLGGTQWLTDLNIESITRRVLREMLEPLMSDMTITFTPEPKVVRKKN